MADETTRRFRGRPKRFFACPACGQEGALICKGTHGQGHIRNVWCECRACGIKLRYVTAGECGRWVRVRGLDQEYGTSQ